ncbi:MAG: aspartate--tRNA ligase, partial [Cytophagales bacterium]
FLPSSNLMGWQEPIFSINFLAYQGLNATLVKKNNLPTELRTHHCGALRLRDAGSEVRLCGWVRELRDKGHLLWIDLRDRHGITQIVLERGVSSSQLMEEARKLGREDVIQVRGSVVEREAKNDRIPTGGIEIRPAAIQVMAKSKLPPFLIADPTDALEALRMQYRYLDLRRPNLQANLQLRHRLMQTIRNHLDREGFMDIETPVLIKSTPEGARDFIVPARQHPGQYYALPQSPQPLKQLLMVAGFDRYYQIAKCFRDEDLRADRQPEFLQLDCEMSFVTQEDILNTFEALVRETFQKLCNVTLPPFPRMTYNEAMMNYGSDKPDLRWDIRLKEITSIAKSSSFPPFVEVEKVLSIKIPGAAQLTRKQLDHWKKWLQEDHPNVIGPVYLKHLPENELRSTADKFYGEVERRRWAAVHQSQEGDLMIALGGATADVQKAMGALRSALIADQNLKPDHESLYMPLWVTDFPLLEWDETDKRYKAMHHPFTAPQTTDLPLLQTDPKAVRAQAYDLVVNGVEIGGGSIRIHEKELQSQMFDLLGIDKTTAEEQFGFLLKAFEYGAPPHGGIAFGLDRLLMVLTHGKTIKDFIPFPKNNQGRDTTLGAPAPIT